MEKKTMGKFIAELRKANGMTQSELAEKLLVSDKTVSRWENDEFTPGISLLPEIADIFGITVDELLRGERNNPEREDCGAEERKTNANEKSDKQSNLMLDKKSRKYTALTCVSISITVVGMLVGLLLRIFAGWLLDVTTTAVFTVAAEICQIIFAIDAFIKPNKDEMLSARTAMFNRRVVGIAVWFSILNLSIPMNLTLTFEQIVVHAMSYGLFPGLAVTQIVFLYIIYAFVVRKILISRNMISYGEEETKILNFNTKLLKKMTIICGIIACALVGVLHVFISPHFYYGIGTTTYSTFEEFKEHFESEYDEYCEHVKEFYWHENEQGELVFDQAGYDEHCAELKQVRYMEDGNGNMYEYYYISASGSVVSYDSEGNRIYNIRVTSMEETYRCVQVAKDCFGFAFVLYFAICAVIYKSLITKNKKEGLKDAHDLKAGVVVTEELVVE